MLTAISVWQKALCVTVNAVMKAVGAQVTMNVCLVETLNLEIDVSTTATDLGITKLDPKRVGSAIRNVPTVAMGLTQATVTAARMSRMALTVLKVAQTLSTMIVEYACLVMRTV